MRLTSQGQAAVEQQEAVVSVGKESQHPGTVSPRVFRGREGIGFGGGTFHCRSVPCSFRMVDAVDVPMVRLTSLSGVSQFA